MRRRVFITLCYLLIFAPMSAVLGRDILADTICVVDENAVMNGVIFAFCEELTIDGVVNGDVFAVSVTTTINGTINGSIYSVGGQLDINGQVTQDIHFGGAALMLKPLSENESATISQPDATPERVTRSIKALTLSTIISGDTFIEGGIISAGYQLIINGDVSNEINYWGSTLIINGLVDGNVFAVVGDPESDSSQIETLLLPLPISVELVNPGLTVADTAEITGLLRYQGPVEGEIEGRLTLQPDYIPPPPTLPNIDEPGFLTLYLEALGSEFSTLLIIGILILFFANNFLKAPVNNLRTRPFASLGVGMLGFLLSFPVVLIVLVLSLSLLGFLFILGFRGVVIAIALVLGLVNVGVISIFYFVAIFVTRAIVGLAFGRFILRVVFGRNDVDQQRLLQYVALALGVLLIASAISLPIIGIIVNAVALFLGLGAVMIVANTQLDRLRTVVSPTDTDWYTPSPAILREHRLHPDIQQVAIPATTPVSIAPHPSDSSSENKDTISKKPGTDNLPDGFDWDFFED